LVVAPALEPGVTAVEVSLPNSGVSFFDFYSRRRVESGGKSAVSLPAPRGKPPPLLVVAGGVVAVAGSGGGGKEQVFFNTTSEARAAPLTLIVALPAAEAEAGAGTGRTKTPTTLRCGRSCKGDGKDLACGDVYVDKGDELDPGPHKRGRTLAVDASSSSVRLSWPVPAASKSEGGGESSSSKCEAGVPWPKLSKIVVLGAGDFLSSSSSSAVIKARVTSSSNAKTKVDASLDAESGALELTVAGGGLQLRCGEDFEVEWK
jgi:hypothetical protein